MSTSADQRLSFFRTAIVAFVTPTGRASVEAEFGRLRKLVPDARVELVDVSEHEEDVVIYHKGDVISGPRIPRFFSYARSLAEDWG